VHSETPILPSALIGWIRRRFDRSPLPRIFPETVPKNHIRWMGHPTKLRISTPPNFGLICGAVILVVMFIFMIFPDHLPYRGLPISLRETRTAITPANPWHGTLSVYLAVGDKSDLFYVNGQTVPKDELGSKLQEQLNHRAEWTVYFEADSDTLNMDAIYAIDTIQGLGAKLMWITPEARKELNQQRAGHPSPAAF